MATSCAAYARLQPSERTLRLLYDSATSLTQRGKLAEAEKTARYLLEQAEMQRITHWVIKSQRLLQEIHLAQKAQLQQTLERQQGIIAVLVGLLLLGLGVGIYLRSTQRKKLIKLLQLKDDELKTAKEEMAQQQEELEMANEMIVSINGNLEQMIRSRTAEIQQKNKVLAEYAFINAHKLRAPVARLLGLAQLFEHSSSPEEKEELMRRVHSEVQELDQIIFAIRDAIMKGEILDRSGFDNKQDSP